MLSGIFPSYSFAQKRYGSNLKMNCLNITLHVTPVKPDIFRISQYRIILYFFCLLQKRCVAAHRRDHFCIHFWMLPAGERAFSVICIIYTVNDPVDQSISLHFRSYNQRKISVPFFLSHIKSSTLTAISTIVRITRYKAAPICQPTVI